MEYVMKKRQYNSDYCLNGRRNNYYLNSLFYCIIQV